MPQQSLSGAVRERLQEIERKLQIGFSHQFILEELGTLGYQTTLKNLRNTLYRARKWAASNSFPSPSGATLEQSASSGGVTQGRTESAAALLSTKNPNLSGPPVRVSTDCTNALKVPRGFEWTGNQNINQNDLY
jgi:hypothetical protein